MFVCSSTLCTMIVTVQLMIATSYDPILKLVLISRPRSKHTSTIYPLNIWDLPILELNHIVHTVGNGTWTLIECSEDNPDDLIRNELIHFIDCRSSQLNVLIHAVRRSTLIHGLYTLCAYGSSPSEIFKMIKDVDYVDVSADRDSQSDIRGCAHSTINIAVGVFDDPWLQRSYIDPLVNEAIVAMAECRMSKFLEKQYTLAIDSESDNRSLVCIASDNSLGSRPVGASSIQLRLFSKSIGSASILCQQLASGLCSPINSGQGHVEPIASSTALRRPTSGILSRLSLNRIPYKSKTTMEPELSLIMSNLAGIKRGSTVLDPYCGSSSLLAIASIHGAGCKDDKFSLVGVDANKEALSVDGITRNFEYIHSIMNSNSDSLELNNNHVLAMPMLIHGLASDLLAPSYHNRNQANNFMDTAVGVVHTSVDALSQLKNRTFDAIITDPPYGIKELFRNTTFATTHEYSDNKASDDDHSRLFSDIQGSSSCDPDEAISTLLLIAVRYLRKGGRLVTFLSHRTIDQNVKTRVRQKHSSGTHDRLSAVSDITQPDGGIIPTIILEHNIPQSLRLITLRRQLFSPTLSRYLCVFERL